MQATALGDEDVAKSHLDEIPGGVTLVDNATVELGRSANIEDVLAYVPGVFAASTSGTAGGKISVRGSGLNSFYQGYVLGVKFLYDGIPIGGPGGTQEDLLDGAAVNYTEVLNGTNAYRYAATSLGGAINFATHTGRSSPGLYGRAEAGSYGYQKYTLSYGGVSGKTDYYFAVLHNEREGFQDNTSNAGNDIVANLGHRFSDRLETRLIYRFREEETRNGSALTLDQLYANPRQNPTLSGRLKPGTHLLLSKTSYDFDQGSRIEFGIGWNSYPLHNGWLYSATPQDWVSHNINTSLRYLREEDKILGRPSKTAIAFNDSRLVKANVTGYNGKDGTPQVVNQFTKYTGSRDTVVSVSNDWELLDKLTLSTGLAYNEIVRDVRILYSLVPNATSNPTGIERVDRYILPRAGLRFEPRPALQVFANVGSAVDAPVTWYYGSTGNPYITDLAPQQGITAEVGSRGRVGPFDGSAALYRSWITHELLLVRTDPDPTVPGVRMNASPTIHQGIELGLNTFLWEGERQRNGRAGQFNFRQSFTLNDFFYQDDRDFGNNRLPGLPTYLYQGELFFQHALGFYVGGNTRISSNYYVDFANTVKAPSYVVWGGKLGWQSPRSRWAVFVDFRNLTNKTYVTASTNAYNSAGVPGRNFLPGDGFSVTGGVSFRLSQSDPE